MRDLRGSFRQNPDKTFVGKIKKGLMVLAINLAQKHLVWQSARYLTIYDDCLGFMSKRKTIQIGQPCLMIIGDVGVLGGIPAFRHRYLMIRILTANFTTHA